MTTTMTLPRKIFTSSLCCVCSKELTDEASVNTGMGPICRSKANALLARELPNTMASVEAQMLLMSLSSTTAEEQAVADRLLLVQQLLLKQDRRRAVSESAALLNRVPQEIAEGLCKLIVHAGYKTYLMYIMNEVAASEDAVLSVKGNLLTFEGVRNYSGNNAFRGCGARWDRSLSAWTIALGSPKATEFCDIVADYWPFTKGLLQQIAAAKTAISTAAPTPAPTVAAPAATLAACILTMQDGHLLFTAPKYNAGAVAEIKAIFGRRFFPEHLSPSGKPAWAVPPTQKTALEAVALKYFNLK